MLNQIVVAGAIVRGCTVLVAQRVRPPELAGRWELPGGKVAAGETERAALARELAEELGLEVADLAVGDRVGDDIALNDKTLTWVCMPVAITMVFWTRGDNFRAGRCRPSIEIPDVDERGPRPGGPGLDGRNAARPASP